MKLYYTEYIVEEAEGTYSGDLYFADTGFGILELGGCCMETVHSEESFWPITYDKYIEDYIYGDKQIIVRIL